MEHVIKSVKILTKKHKRPVRELRNQDIIILVRTLNIDRWNKTEFRSRPRHTWVTDF